METTGYRCFHNFLIPALPEWSFLVAGRDEERPDTLFIADRQNRFVVTLDTDGVIRDGMDYDFMEPFARLEYDCGDKKLYLRYPLQAKRPCTSMGYFHIDVPDESGKIHTCIGQLAIHLPMLYQEGMRLPELQELLRGLRLAQE